MVLTVRLMCVIVMAATAITASCNKPLDDKDEIDSSPNGKKNGNKDAGDRSPDDTSETDPAVDEVKGTLQVPDDFDGTPISISIIFFESEQMVGMPSGFGSKISNPDIKPGETFEITSIQSDLTGEYYMGVTVYCEGGTGQQPTAGVDWIGRPENNPLTLGPGTGSVDAGEIPILKFTGK